MSQVPLGDTWKQEVEVLPESGRSQRIAAGSSVREGRLGGGGCRLRSARR